MYHATYLRAAAVLLAATLLLPPVSAQQIVPQTVQDVELLPSSAAPSQARGSHVAYSTNFEEFELGPVAGQHGWRTSEAGFPIWNISAANPNTGTKHLRGVSSGAAAQALVASPDVVAPVGVSVVEASIRVSSLGMQWSIIPRSYVGETATAVTQVAISGVSGQIFVHSGGSFQGTGFVIPIGEYFMLRIEVEDDTAELNVFVNGDNIFNGTANEIGVERLDFVGFMTADNAGNTFDADFVSIRGAAPDRVLLFEEDHSTFDGIWHRPFNVGDGTSESCGLSGLGTNWNYGVTRIEVDEAGEYEILAEWDGFDGYLFLYLNEFNPADPCLNLIALNDDFQGLERSRILLELSNARAHGGQYQVVGSTYNPLPGETGGDYTISVFGPPSATVIPVELTSFEAVASGRNVNVTWATASETNNAGFEVQMRAFDNEFAAITFVDGAGTTDTPRSYSHTVSNLAPGSYTFRLRQVDFDGAFEYHGHAEVAIGVDGLFELVAFPNPAATRTNVSLAIADQQSVTINVYDALGRRVATLHDGQLEADRAHTFSLDTANLAAGLYIIRATGERFTETLRVTVVR